MEPFAELYPFYHENEIEDHKKFLTKEISDELFGQGFFEQKVLIDAFFKELERVENRFGLIEECKSLISQNLYPPLDNILHSVKMNLYLEEMHRDKENSVAIKNLIADEFQEFLHKSGIFGNLRKILTPEQQDFITKDSLLFSSFSPILLFDEVPKVLDLDKDHPKHLLSVPELLSYSSILLDNNFTKTEIRSIFHNLWQVERLKPLMEICAYFTLGHFINPEDESNIFPQIIFTDRELAISDQTGVFGMAIPTGNCIVVATAFNNKKLKISSEEISGIIIHELHHFWERIKHNNRSLPYKELTPELEDELSKMLDEVKNIKESDSIPIHKISSFKKYFEQQPFHIFNGVLDYDQSNYHAEIVVRIGQSLATLTTAGYTEEESINIIRQSNLNNCLRFFEKEYQEMKTFAEELAELTPSKRLTEASFEEIPHYMLYKSSPFHEAVRNNNIEQLRQLLSEPELNPNKLDSLQESPIDMAIRMDNPQLVFEFSKSLKVLSYLGSKPIKLTNIVSYLFNKTKIDDSAVANQASDLLKNINILSGGFGTSGIFSEIRAEILDPLIIEKLKDKSVTEIIEIISRKEVPLIDKIGNNLFHYLKISESEIEQIDNHFSLSQFYKAHSEELFSTIISKTIEQNSPRATPNPSSITKFFEHSQVSANTL